jgi:hypothetical protein
VREQAINADGTRRDIAPANGTDYSLAECQAIVGGFIELVHACKGWILVVNEEGLLRDLPRNNVASIIAGQQIVGNAMLVRDGSIR